MMRDQFAEIERARSALWHIDPGADRDTWVKTGMAAKAAGIDFDTWHEWSAGAGNFKNEAECRSVWQSVKPGGIGEGSLFHAARAAGWTDNGEAPARRPQSLQDKPKQPEASEAPPHDPRALWDACKPATTDQEYIDRKLGLPDGLRPQRSRKLTLFRSRKLTHRWRAPTPRFSPRSGVKGGLRFLQPGAAYP